MTRPKAVTRHLQDLTDYFADADWEWSDGRPFNAQRAVRSVRRYVRSLEDAHDPGEAVVIAPEWAIIQSCRYAWGRKTYAVAQTADHVRSVWPHLSERTRSVILRDLSDDVRRRTEWDGEDQMDVRTLRELERDLRQARTVPDA